MTNKRRKSNAIQKLKANEVEAIRSKYAPLRDADLTRVGAGDAYTLSDGRVLIVFEDGQGILYPSREQVNALLSTVEKMAAIPPEHPAKKLLPQGKEFVNHVPQLLESLASLLNIEPSVLDKSEKSLDLVEQTVSETGARTFLNPQRLPMLVAYVGEVIRAIRNGKWQMFYDQNTETWEPMIVDPEGRLYQPFALVYQELRRGRQGSIRGATNGALRAHLLSGRRDD